MGRQGRKCSGEGTEWERGCLGEGRLGGGADLGGLGGGSQMVEEWGETCYATDPDVERRVIRLGTCSAVCKRGWPY